MTGVFSRRGVFAAGFAGASLGTLGSPPQQAPAGALEPSGGCLPVVSVRDFGVTGTGDQDSSAAVQKAYESLAETGGVLFFPRGRYRIGLELTRRNVHIVGEGPGASILTPARPDGVILRAVNREASWQAATIRDLTLRGTAPDRQGIGVFCGADAYQQHDEYTGKIYFSRIEFENLRVCIARPYGSIGIWVDACRFGAADYHFWCRGHGGVPAGDPMHAGCLTVTRSHMDYFSKAMLFLDSTTDSGQIVFENNIVEAGSGFVIYIRNFNNVGGMPAISFRNNWNEVTATGRDLEIDGQTHDRARFLFAKNAPSAIRFEDTPVGDMELVASSVETHNCSLQNLSEAVIDGHSTLRHHNARLFSGTPPGRVVSIAAPPSTAGLRTPWFRFAPPSSPTDSFAAAIKLRVPSGLSLMVGGADRLANGSSLAGGTEQAHRDGAGNTLLTDHAVLDGPCWLVTTYIYRVVSGDGALLIVNGTSGLSGEGRLDSRAWEMLVNISRNPSRDPQRVTFYHRAATATATKVEIGGAAIHAFATLQEAMAFLDRQTVPV